VAPPPPCQTMPYGSCGGEYHQSIIGCCVSAGAIGWVRGKRTEEWVCKVIGTAYSQCVPYITPAPSPPPAPPIPPKAPGGIGCQLRPYGGCGGTHSAHEGCCVAEGTIGYDLSSGTKVRTGVWECRAWKGRRYSQCLPTASMAPSPPPFPPLASQSRSAPLATTNTAACQAMTYGRCDRDMIGCCIPSGTIGYLHGQMTYLWSCRNWKGHPYQQCLPEVTEL